MTFELKVIVDVGMNRSELLLALHSSKSEHCALSPAKRQVAVLHPVVGMTSDGLLLAIAKLGHRGAIERRPSVTIASGLPWCQPARDLDPRSACNIDPVDRR
jgi:hypothetical protein